MFDPKTFGANIYLLIGLLIVLAIIFILILTTWTSINVGIWQRRRKKADLEERRRKLQPDGQPYPPAGRGICSGCERGFEKVYHLPSGQRLCPDCYRQLREAAGRCDTSPDQT